MALLTVGPKVRLLRWLVAIAADELRGVLALHVALVAARRLVGTFQGHGVHLGWQTSILESGWGVAVLAVGAKVAVRWLVAASTIGRHRLPLDVTISTTGGGMGALQGHGVLKVPHICTFEPLRRMAVITGALKVRLRRRMATGADVLWLAHPLVAIMTPDLGMLAL
jgi:hypothetical protein